MKRILSLLAALTLLFSAALAEQAQEAPRLIEAPEGVTAALQVRQLEGGQAIGILGVESEPQQRRWEDFSTVFSGFVKKNWDQDVAFTDALWSDGHWIHLLQTGYVTLRATVTDPTPDGIVQEVVLTGYAMECAPDVQVLSAAADWAAAQYGDYGKWVSQIIFMEDHTGDWFREEPLPVWLENGYQLTFGRNTAGCPYGRVAFTEPLDAAAGYAPFRADGMATLSGERTMTALFSALAEHVTAGYMNGSVSAPQPPDSWEASFGGRIYNGMWDDCALLIYTDAEGEAVLNAVLSCLSGDTVSACMHLFPLYGALAGLDAQEQAALPGILDGHGTWEEMSALSPFCVMNGVMLQCSGEEIDGSPLPIAYICGAEMLEGPQLME